jgi:hypothetical protein
MSSNELAGLGLDDRASLADRRLPRRTFLAASGGAVLSVALAALPRALAERGWLDEAAAAELDLTRDTLNGLVAFVTPGDDEYSVAQGDSTKGPGGIAAGTTGAMIEALDGLVPAPFVGGSTGTTLPASGAVAQLLNSVALQVNAGASRGGFASPFARLSFAEKGEVFRRLESDPTFEGTPVRLLAGLLPVVVAFLTFSEAPVLEGGRPTGKPLGWLISNYAGPSDGWREFRGYYGGRRSAANAHRYVRHRHRRRRRRRRRRARRA